MEKTHTSLTFSGFRRLFYLVTPNETTFETLEETPNYLDEAVPWFMVLIGLEVAYSIWKKKGYYRANDAVTSINAGTLQQTIKILFCSFEFSIACWLYDNYALVHLPWDSLWTWIIAFLCVDLSYYWFHRMAHEVNFFWAFHQMHHSSEDFNLSTSLRQGMFQNSLAMLFHLPEALILPPSAHLVHLSLNKISQVWVHTQVIKRLGPLEHVLVTPSHHRVHHGRNRYCIDKNYGGLFIFWDKLFGTFQEEKHEEPVVFGLVHNVKTFDALYCQLVHFKYVLLEKVPSMKSFGDKLKALFYGPGWFPGTPRLGNLSDIPEIENPVEKYDTSVPTYVAVYWIFQLNVTNFVYMTFSTQRYNITWSSVALYAVLIIYSMQCCGAFFEKKLYAPYMELVRCIILYYWYLKTWPFNPAYQIYALTLFALCAAFWLTNILLKVRLTIKQKAE